MSLSKEKTSRTLYISQRYKNKLVQRKFSTVDGLSQVKETAKRCVFSRRLKVPIVCDAVTLDGKLFQTRNHSILYCEVWTVVQCNQNRQEL